jgi:hypothetical protein
MLKCLDLKQENNDNMRFINILEVAKYFNVTLLTRSKRETFPKFIDKLPNIKKKIIHGYDYYFEQDIQQFLTTHIARQEALQALGQISKRTFSYYLNELKVPVYIVGKLSFYPQKQIAMIYELNQNKKFDLSSIEWTEYITLSDAAKIFGRDISKGLSTQTDFFINLNNLTLIEKKVIDSETKYSFANIKGFLETHVTRNDIIDLFGVSASSFAKYVKLYNIRCFKLGPRVEHKYYQRDLLLKVFSRLFFESNPVELYDGNDEKEYISILEVAKVFNANIMQLNNPTSKFSQYVNSLPIKKVNDRGHILYLLRDVMEFLSKHLCLAEAANLLGIHHETLHKYLTEKGIPLFVLGSKKELIFCSKNEIELIKPIVISEMQDKYYQGSVEYISIPLAAELFGKDNSIHSLTTSSRFEKTLELLPNIRKVVAGLQKYFATPDLLSFMKTHITKSEALTLLGIDNALLDQYIIDKTILSYAVGKSNHFIYYSRNDLNRLSDILRNDREENHYPSDKESTNTSLSIYNVAELIGKDPKKLKDFRNRTRFEKYLHAVPIISSFEVKGDRQYTFDSVNQFIGSHINRKDAIKLLNVTIQTFDRYITSYNIPCIVLGQMNHLKFYPRNQFDNIYSKLYYNTSEYMSIYELANTHFNRDNPSFILNLKSHVKDLPKGYIKPVELTGKFHDVSTGRYVETIYSREEVAGFFSTHKSKEEIINNLKSLIDKTTVYKHLRKIRPTELVLGKSPDTIFISLSDYTLIQNSVDEHLRDREDKRNGIFTFSGELFYSRNKTMKYLNVGIRTIVKLEEKSLPIIGFYKNHPYYSKEDVEVLYNIQQKELEKLRDNYYSSLELGKKYNENFVNALRKPKADSDIEVRKIELPLYLRGYFHHNSQYIYKKEDVDRYWVDYELTLLLNSISMDDPFEEFIYKTEQILKIEFSSKLLYTKRLWYENVQKILKKSIRYNLKEYIHLLVATTQSVNLIFSKDIFTYSAIEINNEFLNVNSVVPRNQQREFYKFLKKVAEAFILQNQPVPFSVDDLNNPSDYERLSDYDLSIYDLNEYHEIYEYCNQVEYHKQKAVTDVIEYLKEFKWTGKHPRGYTKYDSCWLYILVQLTNNWRHSTVITQIPRIDLSNTSIQNLEWLKDNTPSIEDANDIIYQIGRYVKHIHKTSVSSEGVFAIGEPLKIAFATAITICELRTKEVEPDSTILIRLTTGENILDTRLEQGKNPHKTFFSGHSREILFENRKMNRTLSTLIWAVLRHLGKGLKESQISRNHLSIQTTMEHYIKLSDNQVNRLVNELFERNNFGFVTQLLSNILFGIEMNKSVETERIVHITRNFGDPIKIEATSGLINRLAQEKQEVTEHIKSLRFDDLWSLHLNSIAGNLPSRERYYQCIYTECRYIDEYGQKPDCKGCGAAIINVYALSQLMDNYVGYLRTIAEEFDQSPQGEKRRLANQFHLIYQVVKEARIRFGRKILDGFVDGGTDKIKFLGELVASKNINQYLTIESGD